MAWATTINDVDVSGNLGVTSPPFLSFREKTLDDVWGYMFVLVGSGMTVFDVMSDVLAATGM